MKDAQVLGLPTSPQDMKTTLVEGRELIPVVIEYPYVSLRNAAIRRLFSDLLALKIEGYQSEHPFGILPVDTYDFISNHVLICEVLSGHFRPLTGFKSVTLKRCQDHHLSFPTDQLLRDTEEVSLEIQRKAIQLILDRFQGRENEIGYNGSWTMLPEIRKTPELKPIIRDMAASFLVHYYRDYKISTVVAAAVQRFKVDRLKLGYGWRYLEYNGRALEGYPCHHFHGDRLVMMARESHSKKALELADRYQGFWDSRVTLGREELDASRRNTA